MKTKLAIIIGTLQALTLFSRADIVLTQDTFVGAATTPMKTVMYIKGDKVRTDNDTSASMIMDTTTGMMTTLMHEQKMVMTVDSKALKASMPKDIPGTGESMMPKITKLDQKETIDGHNCDIYTSELKGMVVKMWVDPKYPGYDKLKNELKTMEKMSDKAGPESSKIDGMMIKSEFEQSGLKFVTKLVSLEEKKLGDDIFAVPAGYKPAGQ
ncbi:MAG: DUF4412 domain-containing protein [Verrucomicrobiaceae bacterium]|nr:DUF4412 domain-containing protein [Verrucomicrobiaceae bacterium]